MPLSLVEKRERARLASERWRRAHGIGPRKPAQRPWLAEGISRSTVWYRRGDRLLVGTSLPVGKSPKFGGLKSNTVLDLARAEAFTRQLQIELAEAARCQAAMAAIIGELVTANCSARAPRTFPRPVSSGKPMI